MWEKLVLTLYLFIRASFFLRSASIFLSSSASLSWSLLDVMSAGVLQETHQCDYWKRVNTETTFWAAGSCRLDRQQGHPLLQPSPKMVKTLWAEPKPTPVTKTWSSPLNAGPQGGAPQPSGMIYSDLRPPFIVSCSQCGPFTPSLETPPGPHCASPGFIPPLCVLWYHTQLSHTLTHTLHRWSIHHEAQLHWEHPNHPSVVGNHVEQELNEC